MNIHLIAHVNIHVVFLQYCRCVLCVWLLYLLMHCLFVSRGKSNISATLCSCIFICCLQSKCFCSVLHYRCCNVLFGAVDCLRCWVDAVFVFCCRTQAIMFMFHTCLLCVCVCVCNVSIFLQIKCFLTNRVLLQRSVYCFAFHDSQNTGADPGGGECPGCPDTRHFD